MRGKKYPFPARATVDVEFARSTPTAVPFPFLTHTVYTHKVAMYLSKGTIRFAHIFIPNAYKYAGT